MCIVNMLVLCMHNIMYICNNITIVIRTLNEMYQCL